MKVEIPRSPAKVVRSGSLIAELRAAGLTVEGAEVYPDRVTVEGTNLVHATVEQVLAAHDGTAPTPEEKLRAEKQATRRAAVKNLRDKTNPTMADAIPALRVWAEEWLEQNGGI